VEPRANADTHTIAEAPRISALLLAAPARKSACTARRIRSGTRTHQRDQDADAVRERERDQAVDGQGDAEWEGGSAEAGGGSRAPDQRMNNARDSAAATALSARSPTRQLRLRQRRCPSRSRWRRKGGSHRNGIWSSSCRAYRRVPSRPSQAEADRRCLPGRGSAFTAFLTVSVLVAHAARMRRTHFEVLWRRKQ